MGATKRLFEEFQERQLNERIREWVSDEYEIDYFDEGHSEWNYYKDKFIDEHQLEFDEIELDDGDDWMEGFQAQWRNIEGKEPYELFLISMHESQILLDFPQLDQAPHHILSMLYGHIVASMEGYLYATFRELVLSDDELSMRLVSNDDIFSKKNINITHLFGRYKEDTHRKLIDEYLQEVLFHNIKRVSFMYKEVLDVEFGEVEWLYRAVSIRHDCVHRAGFDKEGNKLEIEKTAISKLISQSKDFIESVEKAILPHRPI